MQGPAGVVASGRAPGFVRSEAAKPLRVLHVEDSRDDADLIRSQLERGGYSVHVLRVETADQMTAALREQAWDLVISDHSLPTFSAPESFALLQDTGLDIPFIMVSGTVGEDVAVEAMRMGVQDYLLKGNLQRLAVAVERELREAGLRAEQRRMREQLLIAERMAAVGTLAAGIGHEINNSLTALLGNMNVVREDVARAVEPIDRAGASADRTTPPSALELAGRLREPLAEACEAAERVRLIARDLRVFSRSDEDARAPVDLRRVLDSAVRMAIHEIRNRAQLVRLYEDVPLVDANEARLGQVFLNLIVNAAQAIPEGKLENNTITISTRTERALVVASVSDTGSGIPSDVLPRIFDLFYTTKPIGVGTGLGLAICHRIVTGMRGEITVESAVNHGTTFTVTFPGRVAAAGP
jgi:signal transduction histidine kinase